MDFFLFLLVNATLFMRPAEIVPELYGWPIYNCIITANLMVTAPAINNYLQRNGLRKCPTTTCVFGVLLFIVLSQLARFDTWMARAGFFEFVKILAYFLLLMAIINSRQRLITFLVAIVCFTLVLTTIAVLQYHGVIDMPSISASLLEHGDYDETTGTFSKVSRLQATGIFSDPNDLSMILVVCILICTCAMFYPGLGVVQPLCLAPIVFFAYALALTHSRGGLLALFAGFGVLFYCRYGIWKAAVLASVTFPVILIVFGGRQTNFASGISGGTGQDRAELWSTGLQAFRDSPIFGTGYGTYQDFARLHAHNSYVHAFTELGFFGGMMFLGVFAGAAWSLYRLNLVKAEVRDPAIRHFLPFMLAILAAFGISMMSLSRNYVVPTYMVAGLGAMTGNLASRGTSVKPLEFDGKWVIYLAMGSVGMIALIYFYIKILYRS